MNIKTFSAGCLMVMLVACASARSPEAMERCLEEGKAAYREGKYEKALGLFNRAVRMDSREGRAFLWRGNASLKLARSRENKGFSRDHENRALANYNEAIRVNPTISEAFWNRAMIRAKRARYKDAVRDLLEYVKREPRDPEPHLLIGRLYEEKFDDGKLRIRALGHYEQFITLGGRDEEIREKVRAWQELRKSMAVDGPFPKRPVRKPREAQGPARRESEKVAPPASGNREEQAVRIFEEYKRLFASGKPEDRALALERVKTLLSMHGDTELVKSRKRFLELILKNMQRSSVPAKPAEKSPEK